VYKIGVALALVLLLLPLAGGCNNGGCKNDNDCKGARVCENGACVESRAAKEPSGTLAPTSQTPTVPAQSPPPTDACVTCSTQEDFDAAMKKGRKCCPVTACRADSECQNGRVCCRIPNGQLCADAKRCTGVNRVETRKVQITCGKDTCDVVCCATFGRLYCESDPNKCDRAGNGEGTLYQCDGPEDCGTGDVCCLVPMDRTTASSCLARSRCTGVFHHPRYDVDIPLQIVCHTTSECGKGMTCRPDGAISTCQK
jgi:hypothetical protein